MHYLTGFAYFVLTCVATAYLIRVVRALLACRHYFQRVPASERSGRLLFLLIVESLIESHGFFKVDQHVIWWQGWKSGWRWRDVKDFNDPYGWQQQVADEHANNRRTFYLSVGTDTQSKAGARSVHISLENLWPDVEGTGVSPYPVPVVRVEAFGDFDWDGRDDDRDLLRFLTEHFQLSVIVYNHRTSYSQPFARLCYLPLKVDGLVYSVFSTWQALDEDLEDHCHSGVKASFR